jgi:hypothetical protein
LQRVLTTVTLLGLLVATAAAFAITEHLKLIKSPLYGPVISKVFSPVCRCETSKARIRFRLRHPDHVTVTIEDSAGDRVATLVSDRRLPARIPQRFGWEGRTDSGVRAPDGVYHATVHLAHARRTFRFTNRIVLDTTVPHVLSATGGKRVLLAGPGRTVAIGYALSKRAHALVYLGSHLIIRGRRTRTHDKVKWAGTLDGSPLPAGTYVLSVGAQDVAGNKTPAAKRKDVTVVVRYAVISPARLDVGGGQRFTVSVKTAAKRFTWRLGHRHGAHRGSVLHLRAPTTPGTYRLVVTSNGHATTAAVRVHG